MMEENVMMPDDPCLHSSRASCVDAAKTWATAVQEGERVLRFTCTFVDGLIVVALLLLPLLE